MARTVGYPCPHCATVGTYRNNLRTHLMGRRPKGHELTRAEAERVIAEIEAGPRSQSGGPQTQSKPGRAEPTDLSIQDGGTPRGSEALAVTPGHRRALALLGDHDGVRATLRLYRELVTPAGVYLRPTDKGLTVISLDPECPAMVGVGATGSDAVYVRSVPPTAARVEAAARGYAQKLASMRRRSLEERFSLECIRHALANDLVLPGSDLRLICQEWRFPSSVGGGKLDLLALDLTSAQLVVVELKPTAAAVRSAASQAQRYVAQLVRFRDALYPFFEDLANAMATIYTSSDPTRRLTLDRHLAPRVELWSPELRLIPPPSHGTGATAGSMALHGRGTTLDELARSRHTWVASDSIFQRRVRTRQGIWREEHGFPIGMHNGAPLGSRLAMPDAEERLWNFLSPEIGELARSEYRRNLTVKDRRHKQVFGYPRLFADLLSSQPMCFNLFGPLALDLDAATAVARRLWPGRVKSVTAVRFERSPGRWDPRYLDNGSAADVALEHTTPGGGTGVIMVETKYHENMAGRGYQHKARYDEVAIRSGAFITGQLDAVRRGRLQQLWLDHLLAIATAETDRHSAALFVVAYPEQNSAVRDVISRYVPILDPACDSFEARTLEDINGAFRQVLPDDDVLREFRHRYLDLDPIPTR